MIRATYGVTASTSVSVGRMIAVQCRPTGWPPGGMSETAGSTWKTVVANSTTSSEPDDELGQRREHQRAAIEVPSSNAVAAQRGEDADRDRERDRDDAGAAAPGTPSSRPRSPR